MKNLKVWKFKKQGCRTFIYFGMFGSFYGGVCYNEIVVQYISLSISEKNDQIERKHIQLGDDKVIGA